MHSRLSAAFVSADAKRRHVRLLFATIADRYDLITRLLSYGMDGRWKRRLIALARVRPGERALDLATGTGDVAFGLAARGAVVTGLDITLRMLQLARAKPASAAAPAVTWAAGDMTTLPFPSGAFAIVTTSYGLRNVPDLREAVAEVVRVLAPGGRFLSLDFNRPEGPMLRAVYLAYLTLTGSALGWVLHGDPDTYRYIPESIRRYPGAAAVADELRQAGLVDVSAIAVLGGLMTIHVAHAPAAPSR